MFGYGMAISGNCGYGALARLGASFMVTPSRRTHKRLLDAAREATSESPRIVWDGEGTNPYPGFLANADLLVVTADSVNMTGEAAATGRPVWRSSSLLTTMV